MTFKYLSHAILSLKKGTTHQPIQVVADCKNAGQCDCIVSNRWRMRTSVANIDDKWCHNQNMEP